MSLKMGLIHDQGDVERRHGMTLTPLCDRETQSRVAIQKGFIDYVTPTPYTPV